MGDIIKVLRKKKTLAKVTQALYSENENISLKQKKGDLDGWKDGTFLGQKI